MKYPGENLGFMTKPVPQNYKNLSIHNILEEFVLGIEKQYPTDSPFWRIEPMAEELLTKFIQSARMDPATFAKTDILPEALALAKYPTEKIKQISKTLESALAKRRLYGANLESLKSVKNYFEAFATYHDSKEYLYPFSFVHLLGIDVNTAIATTADGSIEKMVLDELLGYCLNYEKQIEKRDYDKASATLAIIRSCLEGAVEGERASIGIKKIYKLL